MDARLRLSRTARRTIVVIAVVVAVGVGGRLLQKTFDSRLLGERGPYLQMPAAGAITVRWQTNEPQASLLRYGRAGSGEWREVAEQGRRRIHSLRLEGLQPATDYRYRVPALDGSGDSHAFTTPPPPGSEQPVRLWVLGDPGAYTDNARGVRRAARSWLREHRRAGLPLLDIWLTTGDNAYTSGRNSEFQQALFEPYADWLARFALWPAYGNHDARRWAFFRIFELPQQGESGGVPSSTEHYYAFDHGNVHVLMLDSQDSDLDVGGEMYQWLRRDLQASTAPWTIAVFHHPPYSRGSNDSDAASGSDWRQRAMRENFLPLLEQHGADLVLNGHSHAYERSHLLAGHYDTSDTLRASMLRDDGPGRPGDPYRRPVHCAKPCGTVYLVIGSSSTLVPGPLNHPAMAVSLARGGSVVIDIDGKRLQSRFITANGEVADRFAIVKGAAEAPAPPAQ